MAEQSTTPTNDTNQPSEPQIVAEKPTQDDADMRAKMIAQHRAMRCIGCGEAEEYF